MEMATKREMFHAKMNQLLDTINDGNISPSSHNSEQNRTKQKANKVDGSVYNNRYQAQKDIINAQKDTISRQKKEIEKLKLQNTSLINEVAFLKGLIENMKNSSISGNKALKEINKIDDKIIIHTPKDPNILQRMKQRDEERKKRWQYIKEQKANKERIEKVMQAEKEEEERQRAIEEKKRKQQEEIDKKIAAEEEIRRMKAKKQIVVVRLRKWYQNYFASVGFWKWTLYIKLVHTKRNMAAYRLARVFAMKYIDRWLENAQNLRKQRLQLAINHREKKVQRKVVNKWIEYASYKKEQRMEVEKVLNHIYAYKIFLRWNEITKKITVIRKEKAEICSVQLDRFLQRFYFNYWKELPKRIQEKREQEQRLRSWHSKVKEILPDFDAEEELN